MKKSITKSKNFNLKSNLQQDRKSLCLNKNLNQETKKLENSMIEFNSLISTFKT